MIKDNRQYFILINSNSISSFLNEKTFTGKIKICSLYRINWTSTQIKNNLDRLLMIFGSYDFFHYEKDKDLYLVAITVSDTDIGSNILINYNKRLFSVSKSLNNLITTSDTTFSNKCCLAISSYQNNSIKVLFGLEENNFKSGSKLINLDYDLLGYKGWDSFSDVIRILNKSCNWVVLRNFEELGVSPIFKKGDDIDILCDDIVFFTAAMNAKKRHGGRCSYYFTLNEQNIPLDIRFVGDKYIDPTWAFHILQRKRYVNDIPVPSLYDYFFTLLYHAKLQKIEVKNIYIQRLDDLAKQINFTSLPNNFVLDDKISSNILNEFFLTNSYTYTYTDDAVRNELFLKLIKHKEINDSINNWRFLLNRTPIIFAQKIIEVITRVFSKKKGFPKVYFF